MDSIHSKNSPKKLGGKNIDPEIKPGPSDSPAITSGENIIIPDVKIVLTGVEKKPVIGKDGLQPENVTIYHNGSGNAFEKAEFEDPGDELDEDSEDFRLKMK